VWRVSPAGWYQRTTPSLSFDFFNVDKTSSSSTKALTAERLEKLKDWVQYFEWSSAFCYLLRLKQNNNNNNNNKKQEQKIHIQLYVN